jgi:ElaB/YqjD/DUF883 family membrane-anchored ribosome-binding protein
MDPAIAKELAALREEIESLRAETRAGQAAGAPAPAADDAGGPLGARIDQAKELIAAMQGVVESAEISVAVHPIAGVAAAFLAGLLIGRVTKSG